MLVWVHQMEVVCCYCLRALLWVVPYMGQRGGGRTEGKLDRPLIYWGKVTENYAFAITELCIFCDIQIGWQDENIDLSVES